MSAFHTLFKHLDNLDVKKYLDNRRKDHILNGLIALASGTAILLTLLFALGLGIRLYGAVITIEGVSMSPTLESGDRVLIMRHWPAFWLCKGQIVVLCRPDLSNMQRARLDSELSVKRIVALSGETIRVPQSHKFPIDESDLTVIPVEQKSHVWHIAQGQVFVRGDNRTNRF